MISQRHSVSMWLSFSALLGLAACDLPRVNHEDLIRVDATIPIEGNVQGELCLDLHYEFSQPTSGGTQKQQDVKKICSSVNVKDGRAVLETEAKFYIPYKEVTALGAENMTFSTMTTDSTMPDFDILNSYQGSITDFKKEAGTLKVQLSFKFSKKAPIGKLEGITNACNQYIGINYTGLVQNCINWKVRPSMAEACSHSPDFYSTLNCLQQAAKDQGTYQ